MAAQILLKSYSNLIRLAKMQRVKRGGWKTSNKPFSELDLVTQGSSNMLLAQVEVSRYLKVELCLSVQEGDQRHPLVSINKSTKELPKVTLK